MGQGIFRAYSFTMGAGAGSATVNLQRAFSKTYLQIPTFAASATALDIYASADGTQTYAQVRKDIVNTSSVQSSSFTVAASAMSAGGIVPIPAGLQFYKVVTSDSAPSGVQGFIIMGSDD